MIDILDVVSEIGVQLLEYGETLSVAESCTGGALSSTITDVPGASGWFIGGAVVYANAEKIRQLGVLPETIEKFGAVSKRCAVEMAEGIRIRSGSTWSLSTTGLAGPSGAEGENEPVGTVFVACAGPLETVVERYFFDNMDRMEFKRKTVEVAVLLLHANIVRHAKNT